MGKHAKPKPVASARRVTAVSAGTLLLCMWGTGTALAASTPYGSGTGSGTLGGVTTTVTSTVTSTVSSVVATPSPSPSSDPIQQVTDTVTGTVKQVTDATGLPDPLATPTPTSTSAGGTGSGSGSGTTGGTGGTGTSTGLPSSNHDGVHQGGLTMAAKTPKALPHLATVTTAAGMPTRSWLAGHAPSVSRPAAPVGTHQVYAAGPATLLAPQSNGIGLPAGNDAGPRALLLVVATAVVAGLSTAHVVVAQRRLAAVSA